MQTFIVEYLKTACRNTPDASAVIFQQKHYSYTELDNLSDKIALGLEAQGVKIGDRVGLYLDKSVQAVAAIYAVLKFGCCYVPMSPGDPVSRTCYMLNNCDIRCLLVSREIKPTLVSALTSRDVTLVDLNALLADVQQATSVFSPRTVSLDEAAAILHTSGSTGDPKGAVITHGNLAVFLSWAVSAFDLDADDCLLSHAPLQFDLSFFDIFCAVAASASVVLAESADTANAVRMARLVNASGITVWQSVPSALSLQTVAGQGEAMFSVRQLLFAGEQMPRQTLLNLSRLFPNARLHNVYGCTETNDTFMYSLPANINEAPDPLPIGKPLPHIRYRIVDRSGEDVAPGQQGHLLVSGGTLMAGYRGAATRDSVVNGYYHTKDLVSKDADGLLHFHGRIDSVVKTNGYRINLTEIEGYLTQSGKFKEVALFCVQDKAIGHRIVAVVRPLIDVQCSPLDLKIYCARGLPKYAIPHSFYITGEELPKGNTGKVDRQRITQLWRQACAARTTTKEGESNHELT